MQYHVVLVACLQGQEDRIVGSAHTYPDDAPAFLKGRLALYIADDLKVSDQSDHGGDYDLMLIPKE